jgi:hypothetical protein
MEKPANKNFQAMKFAPMSSQPLAYSHGSGFSYLVVNFRSGVTTSLAPG